MNNDIRRNIIRGILILFLQVLIFKRLDISIGNFNYLHILIYPMFILLLPIKWPRPLVLIIAFAFGIIMDMFYDSPGVHAAALVFMAYIRALILKIIEPSESYSMDSKPTIDNLGIAWFISYASLALITHHFVYFSLEAFSHVYIIEILLRTIFSFMASFVAIMIMMFITNPKY